MDGVRLWKKLNVDQLLSADASVISYRMAWYRHSHISVRKPRHQLSLLSSVQHKKQRARNVITIMSPGSFMEANNTAAMRLKLINEKNNCLL